MVTVDVLIMGAGLSGSSCALTLAREGWRVLVIDAKHFPRHKTCGGFLGPENREWLSEIGVWPRLLAGGACRIGRSVLTASMGAQSDLPLAGEALGVSRELLDMEMLKAVKAAGVDVYEGARVKSFADKAGSIEAVVDHFGQGAEVRVTARHIVNACGHPAVPSNSKRVQLGIDALYEDMPLGTDTVMLHCCRGGHVGVNPFEKGRVNVCYVVDLDHFEKHGRDPQQVLTGWMAENPHLAKVMDGARQVTPWKAIKIPLRSEVVFFRDGRWHVGDSAAFTDTCTGGGMSLALAGGRLLAQALVQGKDDHERLEIYRRSYQKNFSSRRLLAGLFGRCVHVPWIAQAVIGFLTQNQKLGGMAMKMAHPASPAAAPQVQV